MRRRREEYQPGNGDPPCRKRKRSGRGLFVFFATPHHLFAKGRPLSQVVGTTAVGKTPFVWRFVPSFGDSLLVLDVAQTLRRRKAAMNRRTPSGAEGPLARVAASRGSGPPSPPAPLPEGEGRFWSAFCASSNLQRFTNSCGGRARVSHGRRFWNAVSFCRFFAVGGSSWEVVLGFGVGATEIVRSGHHPMVVRGPNLFPPGGWRLADCVCLRGVLVRMYTMAFDGRGKLGGRRRQFQRRASRCRLDGRWKCT